MNKVYLKEPFGDFSFDKVYVADKVTPENDLLYFIRDSDVLEYNSQLSVKRYWSVFTDDEFKKYFKTIEEFREERLNKLIK